MLQPKLDCYEVRCEDGKRKVTGRAGLKETQTYPTDFGVALRNVFLKNRDAIVARARALDKQALEQTSWDFSVIWDEERLDTWEDASLSEVIDHALGLMG